MQNDKQWVANVCTKDLVEIWMWALEKLNPEKHLVEALRTELLARVAHGMIKNSQYLRLREKMYEG